MAGRKKKRGGEGEHENAERWLLTYADMITLLVAFFIMLYAMSIMNMTKFEQLATSVRSGFGGSMMNGSPNITHGGGLQGAPAIVTDNKREEMPPSPQEFPKLSKNDDNAKAEKKKLDHAYEVMSHYIKQNKLTQVMTVSQTARGVVVTVMTDKMLFAKGNADLKPGEMSLLNEVAKVVNTVPNQVRVEGHTDNLPICTPRFPSNWELSVTRATTVLRYFEQRQVDSKRMEAAGYADQRPLVSNDNEVDRARNRRVEIVLLRQYPA